MKKPSSSWRHSAGKYWLGSCIIMLSGPVSAQDDVFNILSIPASAPLPTPLNAEVEFTSNGFQMQRCKVVVSSGDPVSDNQACKAVTFKLARKPQRANVPVWQYEPIVGNYVMPTPKSKVAAVTPFDYPSESLRRKEQGTTVLRIDVNNAGVITRCDVAASSGSKRLDDTARAGFCRRMKLSPAYLDGLPVASINMTTIKFYLGE